MNIPLPLKKNDLIAIVGPSGYIDNRKTESCIQMLKDWGYQVQTDLQTIGIDRGNYFAGSDEIRAAALQKALDDPNIKAIICARGGYGMSRIIDRLDFRKFKKKPKWVVGYSDITLLHLHIQKKTKTISLHAPMAAAFMKLQDKPYLDLIHQALSGRPLNYKFAPSEFNIHGKIKGDLIGGNLALLAHSIGSISSPDLHNKILFIEDVGEYYYTIDRMLWQLKRAGWFNKIKGLLVGDFSSTKDTLRPFGKTLDQIIMDVIPPELPVAFNIPVGHQGANVSFKCGASYALTINRSGVHLKEIIKSN